MARSRGPVDDEGTVAPVLIAVRQSRPQGRPRIVSRRWRPLPPGVVAVVALQREEDRRHGGGFLIPGVRGAGRHVADDALVDDVARSSKGLHVVVEVPDLSITVQLLVVHVDDTNVLELTVVVEFRHADVVAVGTANVDTSFVGRHGSVADGCPPGVIAKERIVR